LSDTSSYYPELRKEIAPADGRLGVLLPGLGAVSTTLIAGVHLVARGLARPFGSLTQMQRIRLGKRTNPRFLPIKEVVPLAEPKDLVFAGWDVFPDNAYRAALTAGVVPPDQLETVRAELETVTPWPAVFERAFVRNLNGTHVKSAATKRELADAVRKDIADFLAKESLSRAVMVWCGSTEVFMEAGAAHQSLEAFERGLDANAPEISPSMIYAYAALKSGIAFANGAPNLTVEVPALVALVYLSLWLKRRLFTSSAERA